MKRHNAFLIALFLLAQAAPLTWAQDDEMSDSDLQTLLDEGTPPPSGGEVSESVSEPTPAAPEATATVTPSEPVSSETVDIEDLNALESTSEPTSETVATPEVPEGTTIEQPVPVDTSESPVESTSGTADLGTEEITPSEVPIDTPVETADTLEPLDAPTAEPTDTAKVEAPSDELEALKKDVGEETEFKPVVPEETVKVETEKSEDQIVKASDPAVFDVGTEERELLSVANSIQGQISDSEWNEVATAAKVETYSVVKNDWLFKISKKFFGSGFFYPKIWSLNGYITNPHFIEPGMVLSFSTGSGSNPPQVKLGNFSKEELNAVPGSLGVTDPDDLANFGEDAKPKWLEEKNNLSKQGVYFQYASEETMEDLNKASVQALNREYENYQPPHNDFDVVMPSNYDKSGFDKTSKIAYSFKEGFFLNTFISTNIVQDFGELTNGPDENIFFVRGDSAYVKLDDSINAQAGDKFSIYTSMGKAAHKNSDREGYKYAIVAQIKLKRKIKDKWEVELFDASGTPQRGDRVTTYTPKIDRITRTYNSRLIEAGILSTYNETQLVLSSGDVVYLDRGRADGVEMGNTFETFGFKDRHLQENISDQPTYKMGEITVITLTDNFATGLITKSQREFYVGDIAITKTKEAHLREQGAKIAGRGARSGRSENITGKGLEELDVELNLENLNDDLLKQADKIQLTEDELAELERQEREKSVIKDNEKDLKALERLENEIENAESILNDAKLDEDKLLENENINEIEKKESTKDQDSLDEIEENLGKRYVDEDLNSKDNPFGLSEFDVEEIDELLNSEKEQKQKE